MTRDELIELASRYVEDSEVVDFPVEGDLFCMVARELPTDHVLADHEGWQFAGYGLCTALRLDEDEKPVGKWVWFEFVSLVTFPPQSSILKLQPPHVAKGHFQSASRSSEYRMFRIPTAEAELTEFTTGMLERLGIEQPEGDAAQDGDDSDSPDNVIEFPGSPDPKAS